MVYTAVEDNFLLLSLNFTNLLIYFSLDQKSWFI